MAVKQESENDSDMDIQDFSYGDLGQEELRRKLHRSREGQQRLQPSFSGRMCYLFKTVKFSKSTLNAKAKINFLFSQTHNTCCSIRFDINPNLTQAD